MIVQVGSVTIGRGKPLFPRRVLSPTLRLVGTQPMGAGMVELRYVVERATPRGARPTREDVGPHKPRR